MPPVSSIPAKRALPSKEASLFRELLSQYETRQLKKGQKNADQILKKFPEHGETLCMKGLILTHMGKRDEGIELVKKGIRLDLTSHICWHVFGLIQKAEKNYEEALKSYMQALKFDRENINILRDAAHLQTQLRIFDGLVETRYTLVKIRPNLRQHWMALVVAYHLNGNLLDAKKLLEHYEYTLKNIPDYDVEHSETLLYHVCILEDMGETSEALALLDTSAKSRSIVDRTAIMNIRARLLSKLQSEEAEHAWRALIEQNPDCYNYYRGFLSNQGINLDSITDDNRSQALATLHDFSTQIPRATAPRRLALDIAIGDQFKELVKPYLFSGLKKGVPSLFVDVKGLYKDTQKQQVIEAIVEEVRETLSSGGPSSFNDPPSHSGQDPSSSKSSPSEPPTTYLWTLYFLAQHHSTLGRPARALTLLDLAFEHTPTLPELFTCKARVLKRAGDYLGASRWLDEARLLDGQDRFLNTKSAKYRLRAGLIQEANEVLGLFTKKDASSPGADLEDMQSMLYLIEEADAHYRNGSLGQALKKYTAIQKIFDEVEDDQYDFHGYSIRKFTINIYLNLLTWEDTLRSHPAYISAALSASRIFVSVHDDPSLAVTSSSKDTEAAKKAKKKAKKAAQKVHDEAKKAVAAAVGDKGIEAGPTKDDDPDGSKLLASPDGLERAAKLLNPLTSLTPKNIDVWIAVYDVAVRRKKYLQAVKALNHARLLDDEHPELHIRTVEFRTTVSAVPQLPPTPISPILTDALASLLPAELSLEAFNSQYLQRHSNSAKAILAAAKVSRKLGAPPEEIEYVVFTTLVSEAQLDVKTASACIAFLTEIKSSRTDEFRAACDTKFELSTTFRLPTELAVLRKQAIVTEIAGPEKAEILS